MARNDAESKSEGSDHLLSALMEFTSIFYKNNPSAQYNAGSIMSGLTDGFEKMRADTTAVAKSATASVCTFANILASSPPTRPTLVPSTSTWGQQLPQTARTSSRAMPTTPTPMPSSLP